MENNNQLDPKFPVEEGIAATSGSNKMNATSEFISELAKNNPSLDAVIHGKQILSLFERKSPEHVKILEQLQVLVVEIVQKH